MQEELKTPDQLVAQRARQAQLRLMVQICASEIERQFQTAESVVTVNTKGCAEEVIAEVVTILASKQWSAVHKNDQLLITPLRASAETSSPASSSPLSPPTRTVVIGEGTDGTPISPEVEVKRPVTAGEMGPILERFVASTGNHESGIAKDEAGNFVIAVFDGDNQSHQPFEGVAVVSRPRLPIGVAQSSEPIVAEPVVAPQPIRVQVCSVSENRRLLPTHNLKDSIERILATRVEACSQPDLKVVEQPGYNSLIAAADFAFNQHYPLALSPDMIWVTIVQGLAQHVAMDPEKWRSSFVKHEGKALIRIIRNEFVQGSAENDWAGCFPEFSDAIRAHIGDESHRLILSDFSTTGPLEKTVSEIALMDVVKSYFDFRVATLCGIPYVLLEGKPSDWQRLETKVNDLSTAYPGLNWWLNQIQPLIKEFARVAGGARPNGEIWERLFKHEDESGGAKINGWLVKLMPYVRDWRDKSKLMINPLLDESRGRSYRDPMIFHDLTPLAVSVVPFTWEYLGTALPYEFVGGIVAVEQDPDSRVVRPKMGWAVRPQNAEKVEQQPARRRY